MLEALTSFRWLFMRNKVVYFKYLFKYILSDVFYIVVWTTLQLSLNNTQVALIKAAFQFNSRKIKETLKHEQTINTKVGMPYLNISVNPHTLKPSHFIF